MAAPAVTEQERQALQELLDQGAQGGPLGAVEHYGDDPDQVFETLGNSGDPVLLLVRGGFFRPTIDRTHARPLARGLAELGWHVVLAEYRRIPGQPQASVEDLLELETHLRATSRPPVRLAGHSAGGLLALLRALSPVFSGLPPVEVVALAPVADPVRATVDDLGGNAIEIWVGALPQDQQETYAALDPAQLIRSGQRAGGPGWLVHGMRDASVPFTYSRDLAPVTQSAAEEQEPGRPAEEWKLALRETAHHFDIVDPEQSDTLREPWWQPPGA